MQHVEPRAAYAESSSGRPRLRLSAQLRAWSKQAHDPLIAAQLLAWSRQLLAAPPAADASRLTAAKGDVS